MSFPPLASIKMPHSRLTNIFVTLGVDEILAKHVAHLFARDPLVIYDDKIFIDDETHTDHFEVYLSSSFSSLSPSFVSLSLNLKSSTSQNEMNLIFTLYFSIRTFNQQCGKRCASNHPHQTRLQLVGELNFVRWKFRSLFFFLFSSLEKIFVLL
jgi:hypothetical protein